MSLKFSTTRPSAAGQLADHPREDVRSGGLAGNMQALAAVAAAAWSGNQNGGSRDE